MEIYSIITNHLMLDGFLGVAYAKKAPDKDGAGFGDSTYLQRTTATKRFFLSVLLLYAFYGGPGRGYLRVCRLL